MFEVSAFQKYKNLKRVIFLSLFFLFEGGYRGRMTVAYSKIHFDNYFIKHKSKVIRLWMFERRDKGQSWIRFNKIVPKDTEIFFD